MVALGDVSGHGLKAGMSVSMIVGVLRAECRHEPVRRRLLGALNRCLAGRMGGGFATGMVFRLDRGRNSHICQCRPSAAFPERAGILLSMHRFRWD